MERTMGILVVPWRQGSGGGPKGLQKEDYLFVPYFDLEEFTNEGLVALVVDKRVS